MSRVIIRCSGVYPTTLLLGLAGASVGFLGTEWFWMKLLSQGAAGSQPLAPYLLLPLLPVVGFTVPWAVIGTVTWLLKGFDPSGQRTEGRQAEGDGFVDPPGP